VDSHLRALQITQAITLLRPFHSGGLKEITKMPRLYAFDTGFVSHARGWNPLRPDDCGLLWEHLVLEHLQAFLPDLPLHYWRDKTGREVDFVIVRNRDEVDALECKWDASEFDPAGLKAFRAIYPNGNNYLVCPSSVPPYLKQAGSLEVKVCDPAGIVT
jgi:predicted AAA+ superfamily ATPase